MAKTHDGYYLSFSLKIELVKLARNDIHFASLQDSLAKATSKLALSLNGILTFREQKASTDLNTK